MKKVIPIICLALCVGCSNQNLPLRSQIRTGMTITQVQELYGYDSNDPINSLKKIDFDYVDEHITENCVIKTYRYWFKNTKEKGVVEELVELKQPSLSAKYLPYLLTFQTCRLSNYDAVQKEKRRRIDKFNELVKTDPNFQMEVESFCKEHSLGSADRRLLIELLAVNTKPFLPQCVTYETLTKIAFDSATFNNRARTSRTSSSDSRSMQLQQQQQQHIWDTQRMLHQQEFERMQRQ